MRPSLNPAESTPEYNPPDPDGYPLRRRWRRSADERFQSSGDRTVYLPSRYLFWLFLQDRDGPDLQSSGSLHDFFHSEVRPGFSDRRRRSDEHTSDLQS